MLRGEGGTLTTTERGEGGMEKTKECCRCVVHEHTHTHPPTSPLVPTYIRTLVPTDLKWAPFWMQRSVASPASSLTRLTWANQISTSGRGTWCFSVGGKKKQQTGGAGAFQERTDPKRV